MRVFLKKRKDCFAEIIRESSIPNVWWILLFLMVTFLCCTHIYNDILVTAKASHNFWDYIFSGKIGCYYNTPILTPGKYYIVEQSGKYPIVSKMVMLIWMFPVWTIGKIVGCNIYNTAGALIWLKMWLLLSYFISGIKVYDIIQRFRSKTCAANAAFVFYSCVIVFLNTFIVSQIEIFTCLMMLYGIEGWLDNNKKRFLVFFVLAVGMKYFALLAFMPLLLVKEKNIYKIIVYTCVASISLLEVILLPKTGGGHNVSKMLPMFLSKPFIVTIIIALIFAYFYKSKSADLDFKYVIFSEVIIWGAFCLLAGIFPYWSVLLVPFLSLAIGISIYEKNVLVIMETFVTGLLSYKFFCKYYWVYDARTELEMGVVPWLFGLSIEPTGKELGYHSTLDLLSIFKLGRESIIALSDDISLACMVAFIYILWQNYKNDSMQIEDEQSIPYVFRFLVNSIVGLLPVIAFLRFYL